MPNKRDWFRKPLEECRRASNAAMIMHTNLTPFARRIASAATTIGVCLIAAGCGTSSPHGAATSPSVTAQQLAFAKCVRAHGVPSFPDPGTSASGPENSIGGIEIPTSINMQSPAFHAAWNDCQGLIAVRLSPQGKPSVTPAMKASLIAHAQCMRTHGVPGYQDPTFPASGGIAFTDAGTNPQSPAYKHAVGVCASR